MMNLRKRFLLVPALVLTVTGCDGIFGGNDRSAQRELFNASITHWRSLDIDTYSYTIELSCACAPANQLRPVRVTVENGAVVSRIYVNENPAQQTPAPESVFGPFDTADELFDVVEDAINQDADLLNLIYDPEYGVPTLLQFDRSSSDPDDHLIFQVTGFSSPQD
jgi:hypothetical protein